MRLFSIPAAAILLASGACSSATDRPEQSDQDGASLVLDVQTICDAVTESYAYYEARAEYWPQSCETARLAAENLGEGDSALGVLETLIDDLYDPHVSMNVNNQASPRLLPSGADLWIDEVDGHFVVSAVRPQSGAANAGIQIGAELLSFNGLTPDALAATRIHTASTEASHDRKLWALNAALAGRRDQARQIEVRQDGEVVLLDLDTPEPPSVSEPISVDRLEGEIGYIRFNNRLGDGVTVTAFNTALETLRSTEGLILDLRNTPGGGNTNVAEPILGRFISKSTTYQKTVRANGTEIDRTIAPTGDWTYEQPVIVLAGRWTGSMGEGMTIGFDGMQRGTVMGSKMGRLAGGTEPVDLPFTGVSLWLPTYDLRHLDGTPRHLWVPEYSLPADNGNDTDLALDAALERLQQ